MPLRWVVFISIKILSQLTAEKKLLEISYCILNVYLTGVVKCLLCLWVFMSVSMSSSICVLTLARFARFWILKSLLIKYWINWHPNKCILKLFSEQTCIILNKWCQCEGSFCLLFYFVWFHSVLFSLVLVNFVLFCLLWFCSSGFVYVFRFTWFHLVWFSSASFGSFWFQLFLFILFGLSVWVFVRFIYFDIFVFCFELLYEFLQGANLFS